MLDAITETWGLVVGIVAIAGALALCAYEVLVQIPRRIDEDTEDSLRSEGLRGIEP